MCCTAQKMKFSIKYLVTLTEEIFNRKLHFLCSVDDNFNKSFKTYLSKAVVYNFTDSMIEESKY